MWTHGHNIGAAEKQEVLRARARLAFPDRTCITAISPSTGQGAHQEKDQVLERKRT